MTQNRKKLGKKQSNTTDKIKDDDKDQGERQQEEDKEKR